MLDHSYRIFTPSLGDSQDEEYLPIDRIRQGSLAATDLPDGQISDFPVQPSGEKYFAFRFGRNSNRASAVPPSPEGRFAIGTNVGRGMRWMRSWQATNGIDPRTAKSCGADISTLMSSGDNACSLR